MPRLTMTVGLPGSGKSVWAKGQLKAIPATKRVNKDDLRAMMDKSWSRDNEKFVLLIRDSIIEQALSNGYNIIVDDTNLAPKHQERLRELAKKYKAEFFIKDFTDVTVEECIKRDLNRPVSVGEEVIKRMYSQFLAPKQAMYLPPKGKASCIVVDIDGTLAHMQNRSPFEWNRVGEDLLDEAVASLVRTYYQRDVLEEESEPQIILLSGRDGVCRPETIAWLEKNNVPYDNLYMRSKNDSRKDTVIKEEIFNSQIKDNYQVLFVVDDRPSVCRMWRSLGLKVLQVGDPHIEF